MDMMKLMKQAQNIQKRITEVQNEFKGMDISAESAGGAVLAVCDGQGRFKSIKLKAEAINPENPSSVDSETIEMLEDIITTALNQATKQAVDQMEAKMKSLKLGMDVPGLF